MIDDNGVSDGGKIVKGRIIAPGIGLGYVHLEAPFVTSSPPAIAAASVDSEKKRFETAVALARKHLEKHVREFHAPEEVDIKKIVSFHLLMLEDRHLLRSITERIESRLLPAERAIEEEFSVISETLGSERDGYLQARVEDLRDICLLLQKALFAGPEAFDPVVKNRDESPVFISDHLRPSAVIRARKAGAAAFVTSSRAFSSHGAILLRSCGIPSLGGMPVEELALVEGMPILVNAIRGHIRLEPSLEARKTAIRLARELETMSTSPPASPLPAVTSEGREVNLWANIDHPSQVPLCFHHRLAGIGLFRTEFLVLEHGRVPDEEEQHAIYKEVIEKLDGRPLVLRTFDLGGDKVPRELHLGRRTNPALGVRGVRRHLYRCPEELAIQLRAILRAALGADVAVLIPMVTHAGDLSEVLEILDGVRRKLIEEQIPFNDGVRIGAMVEIPSAALEIDNILALVDFVSIGTNDLLQYLTASDRDNPEVIHYQKIAGSGFGPLLRLIMRHARSLGRERDVFVCGELASDPDGAAFVVREGVTSLSVSPSCATAVRQNLGS